MRTLKVIELLAESDKSWEDATQNAVDQAAQTVRNIASVYVKDSSAVVKDNKIVSYRVNVKVSFAVE